MSPETPAGVSVLPDASALPVPAPPGVVLVPATDPAGTAADIAALLGCGRCLKVDEAIDELAGRRSTALEAPAALVRALRADAHEATARALHVRPGLSTVPTGLTAATVRAAAHHLVETAEALHAARDAHGDRPLYDGELAAEARAAHAEVLQARLDRVASLPRANATLAQANLAAAAIVVGRTATDAFDPAFFLVALLPFAALAYAVRTVMAPARRSRAAARRRWSALRAMNVSTLAGLSALEERAAAWERRGTRLRMAEADLCAARDTWTSLVGGAVAIASAERLAADLEAAAAFDETARAATAAWREALVALQEAEDMAGSGWPALVALGSGPSAGPSADGLVLRRLVDHVGTATVVLVVAERAPGGVRADTADGDHGARVVRPVPVQVPVPVPVGAGAHRSASGANGIVDLRERVRAGLHRLRRLTTSPRVTTPTTMAGLPRRRDAANT